MDRLKITCSCIKVHEWNMLLVCNESSNKRNAECSIIVTMTKVNSKFFLCLRFYGVMCLRNTHLLPQQVLFHIHKNFLTFISILVFHWSLPVTRPQSFLSFAYILRFFPILLCHFIFTNFSRLLTILYV